MRKIWILITCLCCALTFMACGDKETSSSEMNTSTQSEQITSSSVDGSESSDNVSSTEDSSESSESDSSSEEGIWTPPAKH